MSAPATKPARWHMPAIRLWHAAILGGFAVAWATGDEDTYAMHFFAGWLVVAVVALRLAAALLARPGSLLSLNRPNRAKAMALGIVVTLALTGLAGVSGAIADVLPFFEDPHEGLAVMALWAVGAHVAVVLFVYKGRQWLRRLSTAALALAVVSPALAGEPARDAIMAAYEKQARAADTAFAGFSAQRGEALYKARNTANPNIQSCSTCHTDDPRGMGRHAKTGRAIEPVAVSANPKRFLDAEKVEERFTRYCKSIMGRVCTPTEKGDYLTFLISR